jgi:2',3'-cyclic-nucleotide 2'-phosphodiesterase (5'-nucleotidase family)
LGGVARRATKIAQEREKGGLVLVLDAGDSLVGDQDPARKTQGRTSVAAMNLMGYDAMALGPQDLALGPGVLQQRIAEAKFAVLSANAVVSATGEPAATPYVLRELGGRQVALVGLSGGSGTKEIAVRDPLETARSVVTRVKGQADLVIVLSHAGASVDQQIADAVPGIALIVSGGPLVMSSSWRSAKTGAFVVQADEAQPGHAGRQMGIATLTIDPRGVTVRDWQRVALVESIPQDPAMAAWVQEQLGR